MALTVLLTGRAEAGDNSVERFQRYCQNEGLSLEELWLAWEDDRAVAATLIVPCPGHTAMQFISPSSGWSSQATAAGLFHHAAAAQSPSRIALVQCLLDPDAPRTRAVLLEAGFEELAVLAYMRSRANTRPHELDLSDLTLSDLAPVTPPATTPSPPTTPAPVPRLLRWSEENRPAFARAILASYEQTLDCPGLVGKREIQDIIAGHMAAGQFRPDLWHAIYFGEEPMGVMLLNDVPANDALELVYLGLAVPWRGHGLAQRLVRCTARVARQSLAGLM